MTHLPPLIQDLGVILITAAVVTLLFKKMKQPVVLGYLIAGFFVGPHVPMLPGISETASIKVWAEMGVIFLLFGLGLEFSFKKLARVGRSASVIAIFEVLFMLGLGYFAGQFLSWSKMDSLFLGGILAISSTTIIVRAFDELGMKSRQFVALVFGVLIVEDLAAILLLVILSTVAATQAVAGAELLTTGAKLAFFMLLWFALGIYILPAFMVRIRHQMNDETALVVSLGLCLLMVIIATTVGFSPALGAFVMGSLLAETREGHHIEKVLTPVRDLFAAVFFVSVGMLLDPQVLIEHSGIIALVTVLTILGKLISTTLGAIISGERLKHAVQSGMSLAQIGEFSFIIATLGVSLNVTSDFLYPIAVAVSAITTFTTPYMIQVSDRFYLWFESALPETFRQRLSKYEEAMKRRGNETGAFGLLWQAYGLKILLNSVVIVALSLAIRLYLADNLRLRFGHLQMIDELLGLGALFLSLPFFWAILFGHPSSNAMTESTAKARLSNLQVGSTIVRTFWALILVGFVVEQFASSEASAALMIIIFAVLAIFLFRFAEPLYGRIEKRFMTNLNDKERAELELVKRKPQLAPWDASLAEFTLTHESEFATKTLISSALKEKFGVTVALIERGSQQILAPGRDEILLPMDRLFIVGPEKKLEEVRPLIEKKALPLTTKDPLAFGLMNVSLTEESPFTGKTIRECGLRELIQGLIVGIERHGKRILSPDSNMILQAEDELWIVGDRALFKNVFQSDLES